MNEQLATLNRRIDQLEQQLADATRVPRPQWMSIAQAAKATGLSAWVLRNACQSGELVKKVDPNCVRKIGSRWKIWHGAVDTIARDPGLVVSHRPKSCSTDA